MRVQRDGHLPERRLPVDSGTIAEVLFLIILIAMLAGPISGLVLSVHAWVSEMLAKGAYQVESTRNLATQLLAASDRMRLLEAKLADAELELTKLRQETGDTNKLRALLGLRQHSDRKTIAADVISRNPDNWFEQVTIDKGSENQVKKGSAVITREGVVGQVIDVSKYTSIVRLVADPDQKIGVLIQRIKQPGVLRGRHRSPPVIDYVPVGTSVDIGDKVVCLGNGGIFPPGHPVGTVVEVKRDTNGTTLAIEIRPSENCFDLTHVLIVPPLDR